MLQLQHFFILFRNIIKVQDNKKVMSFCVIFVVKLKFYLYNVIKEECMVTDVCKSNTLKVIKRDGKRIPFNEDKIGLAIKKGFDSLGDKYKPDDSSLVYKKVIEDINKDYLDSKTIKIEDIQDLIEYNLRELGYLDVLESFASYRETREKSRNMFASRQHKLVKAIEALSLKDASEEDSKRDNANVNGDTAMGTMLQYGSTISKEFSKSYFIYRIFTYFCLTNARWECTIHVSDLYVFKYNLII